MQQFTISFIVFGLLSVLLSSSVTSASVINCPPRNYNYQEFDPRTNKLCSLIEQALTGAGQEREYEGRLDERNVKRQDVDHVFLRFGRQFGL